MPERLHHLSIVSRGYKLNRTGARFWGQVRGFSRPLRVETVLQAEKPSELQGKRAAKRLLGIT
jgi:hypothetical protein